MLAKFLVLAGLAASAAAQNFTINTPAALIECQPVALSWSGGSQPFILAIIPGGQVSAAALENVASGITADTYSWTVDIASGTSVTIKVTDSTGAIAYSSPDTIQAGSSSSCLNSTSSGTSGSATSGATGATGGVSGSGAASSGAAATGAASGSTTSGAAATGVASGSASAPVTSSASTPRAASSSASASASASASKASSAGPVTRVGVPILAALFIGGLVAVL